MASSDLEVAASMLAPLADMLETRTAESTLLAESVSRPAQALETRLDSTRLQADLVPSRSSRTPAHRLSRCARAPPPAATSNARSSTSSSECCRRQKVRWETAAISMPAITSTSAGTSTTSRRRLQRKKLNGGSLSERAKSAQDRAVRSCIHHSG